MAKDGDRSSSISTNHVTASLM